jgi:hypothetical protein
VSYPVDSRSHRLMSIVSILQASNWTVNNASSTRIRTRCSYRCSSAGMFLGRLSSNLLRWLLKLPLLFG